MSLRPPRHLTPGRMVETGLDILGHEMRAEQASSLGHAGRKVEAALAVLRGFEGEAAPREALLSDAADAVWAYFIQRELIGLRNTAQVIRDFAIPGEVLARLGVSRGTGR
jgi:hypothetical protein